MIQTWTVTIQSVEEHEYLFIKAKSVELDDDTIIIDGKISLQSSQFIVSIENEQETKDREQRRYEAFRKSLGLPTK